MILRDLNFIRFEIQKKRKIFNICFISTKFFIRRNIKKTILISSILIPIFSQNELVSNVNRNKFDFEKDIIKWKKIDVEEKYKKEFIWEKIENNKYKSVPAKEVLEYQNLSKINSEGISSFNRSIVFNNSKVGPDISWLVPPGFKWNNKYKFDASLRGHSRRKLGEQFLDWNKGDAVGQFYYQFLNDNKTSFGINAGIRSVYSGSAVGGSTNIGEGQSLGFRIDRRISATEGFAFGGEQLLHFDGLTDTGRDIYLTFSKGLWRNNKNGKFPLDIYTFGFATGKMSEGNIKFLCSNLLGGSGTEILHQRSLCWAPVFSISRIFNEKFSTFFEYNSKWFLLGTSIVPFNQMPLRGTFAVQLSDHIDNYKLNRFDELKWVFRLSLGF